MTELFHWVALALTPGVGPRTARLLREKFGQIEEIFKASRADLVAAGVEPDAVKELLDGDLPRRAEREIKQAQKLDIHIIPLDSERYPRLLKEIYDPPIVLYVNGNLDAATRQPCISIVGTRTPSNYGVHVAENLATDLAKLGITIVSGLARGIDTAGHRGALAAKGQTVAVLGSGVDVIYPKENYRIAGRIAENGAVISEFPLGMYPAPQNFPIRNRIISGLSLGTVVVEASEYSGSLITTRMALEQNREVFAVPGYVTSPKSFGPNYLIKQGAKLVQSWQDVVEELPSPTKEEILGRAGLQKTETKELPLMTEQESLVLNQLVIEQPRHIDKLLATTGLGLPKLSEALLTLEIKGLIKQLPGKNFVRR